MHDREAGESCARLPLPEPWTTEVPYRYALPKEGDCWKECSKRVDKHDEERCRGWREDIDTLLVFAGLFSAVVTAFTVESYQWLDIGHEDVMVQILYTIAQNLNATTITTPVVESFGPSASAVRINAYWFLSLTLSLTAVIVGILCKQWIREHRRDPSKYMSHKDHFLLSQIRRESLEMWGVPGLAHSIPVLLEIALVLFFLGVMELLWSLNTAVALLVTIQISLAVLAILATTVLPTLSMHLPTSWMPSVPCAFKSPQSWLFYRFVDLLPKSCGLDPFFRRMSDWFVSDTSHPSYITRDINHHLVESAMDWMNEAFGASRQVSMYIYHCLEDYASYQGVLPRSLQHLSDFRRYQLMTKYHDWFWWDDPARRWLMELLLRAVGDPKMTRDETTMALDQLGRMATTFSLDSNPQRREKDVVDADPTRFKSIGEDLLLQVLATLDMLSHSDHITTTHFLACYSILNRYWIRMKQEWPDKWPGWHQPTSFVEGLTEWVASSPEHAKISRVTKCTLLLDSVVHQTDALYSPLANSGDLVLDFAKMLDKTIHQWGIGPSLVNVGGSEGTPWRDVYQKVIEICVKVPEKMFLIEGPEVVE